MFTSSARRATIASFWPARNCMISLVGCSAMVVPSSYPRWIALLFKDVLRDHAVDALDAVHDLRHLEIDGDAGEGIGVLAREALFRAEEVDRLADRHLHRLLEVLVEAERDPVRRRLGPRPGERPPL